MVIALTGFMGCGKSSVGKEISTLLGIGFTDLDTYIEKQEGMGIGELFSLYGEKAFREKEATCLEELLGQWSAGGRNDGPPAEVLSLGGGTLTTEKNRRSIKEQTLCIYLKTRPETLAARLQGEVATRPLLQTDECRTAGLIGYISQMLDRREEAYTRTSRLILETDGKSTGEIAVEICSIISKGGLE